MYKRQRERREPDIKKLIARKAASLVKEGACVYRDASTTVAARIPFLPDTKSIIYVTNSPLIAQRLAERNLTCYVTGGELKLTTNAFIGSFAIDRINHFNFAIGFFGTNGIHPQAKFTTPDPQECAIKMAAISKCFSIYILADHTKLDRISTVTFCDFAAPTLITDERTDKYRSLIKSIEVGDNSN